MSLVHLAENIRKKVLFYMQSALNFRERAANDVAEAKMLAIALDISFVVLRKKGLQYKS